MNLKLVAVSFALAVTITAVAIAADTGGKALNTTTPGGIAPKAAVIQRQARYSLQCDTASCYKVAPALQADGGLQVDCTADFNLQAGVARDFESATAQYLSIGAVADGGTPGCRLFLLTKNNK